MCTSSKQEIEVSKKLLIYIYIYIIYIKPLKSEAIHETGLSGNVVASFFPLIIFIYIYIFMCLCLSSTIRGGYFKSSKLSPQCAEQ